MAEFDYSWENPAYRDTYHHTCSHILAQAVKRLYPDTKLAIGPAIEDGFYYDLDSETVFTPEELEKIEAEMKKICTPLKTNPTARPIGTPAPTLWPRRSSACILR